MARFYIVSFKFSLIHLFLYLLLFNSFVLCLEADLSSDTPPHKIKVVSSSLSADEIIFSLINLSQKKDKYDVYYSYVAYSPTYSNISDLIDPKKIFHINKESLLLLDPDIIFLSPYNKAEFLESIPNYSPRAKAISLNPSVSLDDLLSNIRLVGEALSLKKQADHIIQSIQNKITNLKSKLESKKIRVLAYMPHNIAISSYTLIDNIFSQIGIKSITDDSIGYAPLDEERLYLRPAPDYIFFISEVFSDRILNFALSNSFLNRITVSKSKIIHIPEKLAFCTSGYIIELVSILESMI